MWEAWVLKSDGWDLVLESEDRAACETEIARHPAGSAEIRYRFHGLWKCRICPQTFEVRSRLHHAAIEDHLVKHGPLDRCLGSGDLFACTHLTNPYESDSPGYCIDCASHPSWQPVEFAAPSPQDSAPGRLVLREESGGLRHYLGGQGVHAGDILELLLEKDAWIAGRYEWSYQMNKRPAFYICLGGNWERDDRKDPIQVPIALPENATLRWPPRKR